MRSTRRNERVAAGVLAAAAVAVIGFVAIKGLPPRPDGPRYMGAGAEAPVRGGTFVFHHESSVRGMDPHISFDELSNMAIRLVFDGLLDYDEDANLVPSLAEAMPEVTEDGTVFTFRLRPGVRFHDGHVLVAEDVRWSLERMLHHDTGSPGYPFFKAIVGAERYHAGEADHVEGIEVLDEHTVRFRLTEPDQTFLNAMAMTFAYPVRRDLYERWGDDVGKHPVGTGPFRFVSWERGVQLVFERHDDYFRPGLPYADRMVFLENLKRHLAVMRFANGDLDAVHRFSPADYLIMKGSQAWAPYRVEEPAVTIWGFGMNTEIAPFDDVHVRRAVAFAIDREGWDRARAGRLAPTGQPLPPQLMGYDPELPNRQFLDLERAREEMRLAGYPVRQNPDGTYTAEGFPDEIVFWTGEGETSRFYGELAQHDLSKIGINLRVRQVAFAVWLQQTGKRGTAQSLLTGWNMDFPDPANFLDILWHTRSIAEEDSNNRTFYSNPELDALLDRARAETDRERRREMYRQASDIVAHDAPWAFIFCDTKMEMWQPYVRNYRPHPVWSEDYRNVWLDLPRRRVASLYLGAGRPSRMAALFPFGGL